MEWLQEFAIWLRQLWVVWLLLLFLGIVAWVFWPGRKDRLERHGRIPLDDNHEEK